MLSSKSARTSHDFTEIKVIGDGRCFFRSIIAALYPSLRNGDHIREQTERADELRQCVCELLTTEVSTLEEVTKHLPYLLEQGMGQSYESVKDRIADMRRPGTYAGNLEIAATSFILKTQIHIYQGEDRKLVAKVPTEPYCEDSEYPAVVLHNMADTDSTAGHFNLLVENSHSCDQITNEPSNDLKSLIEERKDSSSNAFQRVVDCFQEHSRATAMTTEPSVSDKSQITNEPSSDLKTLSEEGKDSSSNTTMTTEPSVSDKSLTNEPSNDLKTLSEEGKDSSSNTAMTTEPSVSDKSQITNGPSSDLKTLSEERKDSSSNTTMTTEPSVSDIFSKKLKKYTMKEKKEIGELCHKYKGLYYNHDNGGSTHIY